MSTREVTGLMPVTGWKELERIHEDVSRNLATSLRRRSVRQSTATIQATFGDPHQDEQSPPPTQSTQSTQSTTPSPGESSTAPIPPSPASTQTTDSMAEASGSELSPITSDLSDLEFDPIPSRGKRRKTIPQKPTRRVARTRKTSRNVSGTASPQSLRERAVSVASPHVQLDDNDLLPPSRIVRLKVSIARLTEIKKPESWKEDSNSTEISELHRRDVDFISKPIDSLHQPDTNSSSTRADVLHHPNESPSSPVEQLPKTPKRKRRRPKKALAHRSPSPSQPPTSAPQIPLSAQPPSAPVARFPLSGLEPSRELAGPHFDDVIQEEYEELAEISKQLTNLSSCPHGKKPFPIGKPEVWADGRQSLCETLPYYRAYQSAGYCSGGFAISFMFDKESSPRDYMDSEVVISRAGGGMSRDKATGDMIREKDQAENSQVASVRNSMNQYNPVAMLSGDRNPNAPSKMPHPYNVLDWFKPTHIWFEKSNGRATIRYRFEKLNMDKSSWWAPYGRWEPAKLGDLDPPEVRQCQECQKHSQMVYLQGWMCLQPDCSLFWKLESGCEPKEEGLLYDPRFLKQYTPWPHGSEPQSLRPDHMKLGPTPVLGEHVSWAAGKGMVCPSCGRCNSREAWMGWECGNPGCDFTYSLPHANIPATALHDPYNPLSSGYAFSKDCFSPLIPMRVEFAHGYRINYFSIPGIPGFIAHFIANKTINEEPGGPDDMWADLQTTELGLRRRPIASTTLRGPMLTQHFCVNYGMPYKFIASTASRPFSTACTAIKSTRSRLNWAARHCVGISAHAHNSEFNELLALGYFERQSIDYHDDGEFGLGPTIATLSLGAPATMKIRLKAKHHNGISRSGAYVNKAPVFGCVNYEQRKAAHAELEALRAQCAAEEDFSRHKERMKALPKELGLQSRGNAKDVLSMRLGHGDVVVMHGAQIQEYYEHTVDPVGKLRFALTCRYIDPESLKPEDRPPYEVEPDEGCYDGSKLPAVPM